MIFSVTWGVMQIVFGPVMGLLSDRFGRRPVLLISIFGLGLDYLFMALAPSLGWLYVGRLINGATSASFSTANAYIADVTAPEDRARAFGLMGAAFGAGFIIGPAVGGLLGGFNLRLPFYFSAGLALVNWLYGYFVLPESLAPALRAKGLAWRQAVPFAGAMAFYRANPQLLSFALVMLLFQLAHSVFPSIFVLFVGWRFGWGPREAGYMLMATGSISILTQYLLVGRVVKRAGERGALLIGLASASAAFVIYALSASPWMFGVGLLAGALSALIGPGLGALMSGAVGPSGQGQLQGANAAISGVSSVLGPIIYLSALAFAVRRPDLVPPGFPVLIAAALSLGALVVAFRRARAIPLAAGPASA
jgi:DHA1 family tetracycline resistance protein-like MFS transporter